MRPRVGLPVGTAVIIAERPDDQCIYTGRVVLETNERAMPEKMVGRIASEVASSTGHQITWLALIDGNHSAAIGELTDVHQVEEVLEKYASKIIVAAAVDIKFASALN